MKRILVAALALAMTAGAAVAYDAASQVKARQANMKSVGGAAKGLADALGDKDVAKIKEYAARLNTLAPQVPSWFPAGSGPASGEKTKAKAEIWTDSAGFKAAAANLATRAAALNAAAQTGDVAKAQAEFGQFRGACKGCHDKYKES